ncbi:divergent polysaccharide deacetylase family protein [Pseudomonas sp. gcc21]|uniref:divergent polysaccharide deacetylase family protein n=1 Tax=Pseudomonas sp. gcc21 TaxID=2726989 RepID=UPI00145277E9|nr:divergent polysaccharide deacetylase family protein [Pseudomonas sp. gcc21]QJD59521.1 divergent polysaccharide deacetylase family protein [Pseudomonas sp. gcc21]
MKPLVLGLLAIVLAACSDPAPEFPASEQTARQLGKSVETRSPAIRPATPEADHLRAEWMRIEHAGWETLAQQDEPPLEPATAAGRDDQGEMPALGIIIDDLGHNYARGRRVIDMPAPVTLAILPHTAMAARLAKEASAAGRTVIVHLPMQNGANLSPGPGALFADMDRDTFTATLEDNLEDFGPVAGVNNHMGSLLTTLRPQMNWLMAELRERDLFFVDSRTSAQTQAAFAAEEHGVAHISRDVFLDNELSPVALQNAFGRALAEAREKGVAVLIGHPHEQTLAFLERVLPGLEEREGVRVVAIGELLGQGRR